MSNERKFSLENAKNMLADEILSAYREVCRVDEDLIDAEEELIIHALSVLAETNEDSDKQYVKLWALIYMLKGIWYFFAFNR